MALHTALRNEWLRQRRRDRGRRRRGLRRLACREVPMLDLQGVAAVRAHRSSGAVAALVRQLRVQEAHRDWRAARTTSVRTVDTQHKHYVVSAWSVQPLPPNTHSHTQTDVASMLRAGSIEATAGFSPGEQPGSREQLDGLGALVLGGRGQRRSQLGERLHDGDKTATSRRWVGRALTRGERLRRAQL